MLFLDFFSLKFIENLKYNYISYIIDKFCFWKIREYIYLSI